MVRGTKNLISPVKIRCPSLNGKNQSYYVRFDTIFTQKKVGENRVTLQNSKTIL